MLENEIILARALLAECRAKESDEKLLIALMDLIRKLVLAEAGQCQNENVEVLLCAELMEADDAFDA